MKPQGIAGKVDVLIGGPKPALGGCVIGTIDLSALRKSGPIEVEVSLGNAFKGLEGKQSLFFSFSSPSEYESLCTLYDFQFFAD